jgi:NDP-sugar pyrophosphorylase family protein
MSNINSNIPIIILAGGKGQRFISNNNLPKQLTKVSKHPIILEIILYYYKNGFNLFVIPLGYKKKNFFSFFNNKKNIKRYNLNILTKKNFVNNGKINILLFDAGSQSNKLLRIKKSINFIEEKLPIVGVCYGDIFANIKFKNQLSKLKKNKTDAILAAYSENSPFGHLGIKNNLVKSFIEKPKMDKPINIGFYFFKKKIFSNIKFDNTKDLESNFLPYLAIKKKLIYHLHKGFHFTVNNQKDLIDIKKKVKKDKNFLSKL